MKTTIKLSVAILNLLVVCNLLITSRAFPVTHKNSSIDPEVMKKKYETWMKRHGRRYRNKEEFEVRFGIYQANLLFIEFHNSQHHSYKLTDNKFADLTNEEFKSTYLGFQPKLRVKTDFMYLKHGDLPKSIDWRKKGATARNEKMLKAAVAHQPVSVATDAGGYAFQFYSKGIFSGSCGKDLNHGMTIVGYGEENGENYWIVRNSWANDWGESGYVRMKRDTRDKDGTCGIAMDASYPVKH